MKIIISILFISVLVLPGCGAEFASDNSMSPESDHGWGGSGGGGGSEWDYDVYPGAASDAASSADYGPPPVAETEFNFNLNAPQASENYVYIAATQRDSLVRINADESLEIRLIPVGGQPTTVATLATDDVALVINRGTQDFSIVRSSDATDEVTTVNMLPNVNSIRVSPDDKYALVYYNEEAAADNEPVGDFQTIAIVNMVDGKEKVRTISTGFHITTIYFDRSKPVAYLVTDDGVAILDLKNADDGSITPLVAVTDNPIEDPAMREVLVTEDGSYAVVRHLAKAHIRIVELNSGTLATVDVAGLPTDVDLIPGADAALLVLREQKKAYVVDLVAALEAVLEDDEDKQDDAIAEIDITGSQAGAAVVTKDGTRAVLYTTVGEVKAVTMMDLTLSDYPLQTFQVQKSVVGVDVSEGGNNAIVFHDIEAFPADAGNLEKTIAQSHGFTLFDLDTGYRKLIQTNHKWSQHLFIAKEPGIDLKAYVLTPDPAQMAHKVQEIDLTTYIVSPLPIASRPLSMVYVPASRKVAVSQDHLNGRITFVDVDSGETYSVTGYELNGLIH
jgi:hypothetical protein